MNDIITLIKESQKVAIASHMNPDGDALGSTFGLAKALQQAGKEVHIFFEEKVPKIYQNFFDDSQIEHDVNDNERFDIFLSLDISTNDRLGKFEKLNKMADIVCNIDHHLTNTGIAKHGIVIPDASATAEIIYDLLKIMKIKITDEIAQYIYIGILTDTGGFQYSSTSSKTMSDIAELMEHNINTAKIYREVFETISYAKLKLLQNTFKNVEIYCNGKLAIFTISREIFEETGATYEECDGIVNYARSIEGVEVGVLVTEKNEKQIKVSMRANEYLNVGEICAKFGGGGHEKAAGFIIDKEDLKTTKEQLKQKIVEEISKKI